MLEFVKYDYDGSPVVALVIGDDMGELELWATYIDDLEICVCSSVDYRSRESVEPITLSQYIAILRGMEGQIYHI